MTRRQYQAFTIIELMVVVTIIVVLLALMAPALDKAMTAAEKAVCASRLDAIGSTSAIYAMENKREYFICRGRNVQLTFAPEGDDGGYSDTYGRGASDRAVDWLEAMSTVGLAAASPTTSLSGLAGGLTGLATEPIHEPLDMWYCPSTKYRGFWDGNNRQYWVGYQWYGGIIKWYDTAAVQRPVAQSPVNLSRSKGSWVLVADRSFTVNGTFNDFDGHPYWMGQPNHKSEVYIGPEGNNEAFVDGSVAWTGAADLVMVSRYAGGFTEMGFIGQRDLGFEPQEHDRAKFYFR